MKYQPYVICCLGLMLIQCRQKTIDLQVPFEGSQMVLHSVLETGKPVEAVLMQTWPAGKNFQRPFMANVKARIYQNGLLSDTLIQVKDSLYRSKKIITQALHTYFFEASADGLPSVKSKPVTVPMVVNSMTASFTADSIKSLNSYRKAGLLQVSFQPMAAKGYYYLIEIKGSNENNALGWPVWMINGNDEFKNDCRSSVESYKLQSRFVFSGHCYQSTDVNLLFGMEYYESKTLKIDKIKIQVSTITEDYYMYLKDSVRPSDIEEAFYEPAVTYSNVIDGLGIIAGKNTVSKNIMLKP